MVPQAELLNNLLSDGDGDGDHGDEGNIEIADNIATVAPPSEYNRYNAQQSDLLSNHSSASSAIGESNSDVGKQAAITAICRLMLSQPRPIKACWSVPYASLLNTQSGP